MTNDLDTLRAALKDGMPTPDADKRARNIDEAQNLFSDAQGSAADLRPTPNHPQDGGGIWRRISEMLQGLKSRPALLATSSFAVLAMALTITTQTWLSDPSIIPEADLEQTARVDQNEPVFAELASNDVSLGRENFTSTTAMPEGVSRMLALPAPAAKHRAEAPQGAILLDLDRAPVATPAPADAFPDNTPSGLKLTAQEPVSTFSVDVDTTSYALWRMATLDGYPFPKDAIRVEEMINYFDYDYPVAESLDAPISTSVSVTQTPWNEGTRLMQIGIQGYELALSERAPMGLVFLIDTSGSMEDPMKLPLLRKSFGLLLNTLQAEDTVSIVTYAGSAGVALEPTPASEKATIMGALEQLSSGGSTAGQAGLQQAYSIAETMREDGKQARIILATDGDFNVGISDPDTLTEYVAEKRKTGVFLSVLGFGRGNYSDTIMQAIAQNGNGVAAYIDSLAEAQKVLVEDVTGSLVTIASDVKIQVEFNPAQISEYRLIGYETRALNREDFNNDKVDAGEIGAGHTVTAIYEITPVGSPAELADPLRYSSSGVESSLTKSEELAYVKLRYKKPGATSSLLVETPVTTQTRSIPESETNFATSVAAVGQIMRGVELGKFTLSDARQLANQNKGADPYGYRAEFVKLLRLVEAQ